MIRLEFSRNYKTIIAQTFNHFYMSMQTMKTTPDRGIVNNRKLHDLRIMAMPTTNVHGIWLYGRQTIHLTLTHYSRCGTLAAHNLYNSYQNRIIKVYAICSVFYLSRKYTYSAPSL